MGTYKFRIRKYHKSLSQALNIHLFGSESLQEHSESYKQAFREHNIADYATYGYCDI